MDERTTGGRTTGEPTTDERMTREGALREQLYQLDQDRRRSALTPGEARVNEEQRRAVIDELRGMGVEPESPAP